jgi:hypothetical protein
MLALLALDHIGVSGLDYKCCVFNFVRTNRVLKVTICAMCATGFNSRKL